MSEMRIVRTGCAHECGGGCVLKAHVRDGVIVRLTSEETPPGASGRPSLRACSRGRAYRQRLYSPDRLKVPLKRVGERGEGKFEPLSWDEALTIVSREMLSIRHTYGPAALLNCSHYGNLGVLHGRASVDRLLNLFGGQTELWGILSNQAEKASSLITLASSNLDTGREQSDFPNSRLIILWGWNPVDTMFGNGTTWWLMEAKRRGTKLICIDPRFTESAATASEHIPIRPSTDAAMMLAMAHVLIEEDLCDRAFLSTYTLGFDEEHLPLGTPAGSSFESYVLGLSDGEPKTPAWAAAITGVPAETIVRLAREFATSKPAALHAGFGPGRTAQGESFHRLAITLAAMTGNIGVSGGNIGMTAISQFHRVAGLPVGSNPTGARVNINQWADAILQGKDGGFPSDIRMVYSACGNLLNQIGDVNKSVRALRKVDFVVVHEHFITPMARFADILLPATTWFERNDFAQPWGYRGNYAIFLNKAIEPMYECRGDLDICTELAHRLEVADYNPKSEEEWLREFASAGGIDDFDRFRESGVHWFPEPEVPYAFKKEIEDPATHPFKTPSGKIEIFSTYVVENPNPFGLGSLPVLPTFEAGWEGPGHVLAERYPLQLITPHSKRRAHSTYDNLPWLRETEPQAVWINPSDAGMRGIKEGDCVQLFNDRGRVRLPAKVTPRVMEGVVSVNQGAWHAPDEEEVDGGGCGNVLLSEGPSAGGGAFNHTALVQVELARRGQ